MQIASATKILDTTTMTSPNGDTPNILKSTIPLTKSVSSSSISSLPSTPRPLSKSAAPTTPATPTKQNLSAFAPWDHDQFVARLATFRDILWSQLPEELCELEWARRGWVEKKDGKKGVGCGLCHGKVEVLWDWERLRHDIVKARETVESAVNGTDEPNGTHDEKKEVESPVNDMYSISSTDGDETDLLLKHYKPLLSTGHTPKCPWSNRSTDPTILRLP